MPTPNQLQPNEPAIPPIVPPITEPGRAPIPPPKNHGVGSSDHFSVSE